MDQLKNNIEDYIYKLNTSFDVHIITLSEKTNDYDRALWMKFNDDLSLESWWQDFKDVDELSDYDFIIFGIMSLMQRMGNQSLLSLELREVENYLRPSNLEEAIKNFSKYQGFYDETMHSIIKNSVHFAFLKSGMTLHIFDTLDYEGKINVLNELSKKIEKVSSDFFSHEIKVELLSFAESKAVYEFSGVDKISRYFKAYIEGILQYLQLTLSTEDILIIAG